ISQICDKKNQVLFTDTECLVLFKDFKLPDDSMVVLKLTNLHAHKKPQLILQPTDTPGDKVDDSPFPSADEIFQKELARLKDQEQRVTSDAESLGLGFAYNVEELQTPPSATPVPPGCILMQFVFVEVGKIELKLGTRFKDGKREWNCVFANEI
nr:ribonuclease H-like domain-containing protein [Tanacetum cinerariifolium]